MSLEIAKSIKITENLCDLLDSDCSLDDLEKPTMEVLRFLWEQSNLLYDLVQNRAESEGISGKGYFDGVKLGELAHKIASKLRVKNLSNPEEIALKIRLKAILQVQNHYHHIIGPAMLEHSAVLESLGRIDEAADNYECIISDFSWFLDDYSEEEKIDNEEDVLSIQSLQSALHLRLKQNPPLQEKKAFEEKLKKIEILLSN